MSVRDLADERRDATRLDAYGHPFEPDADEAERFQRERDEYVRELRIESGPR
jgi:hypothetical protein